MQYVQVGDGAPPPSDKSAPLAPFGLPPLIDGEDAQGAIMDRYERRALSRRKFAIRAMDAHRLAAATDEGARARARPAMAVRSFWQNEPSNESVIASRRMARPMPGAFWQNEPSNERVIAWRPPTSRPFWQNEPSNEPVIGSRPT
jgi:hypothetical protein